MGNYDLLKFLSVLIQINSKSVFLIHFCQKFQKKSSNCRVAGQKNLFSVINFNQRAEMELCLFISKASAHPTVLVIGHDSSSS